MALNKKKIFKKNSQKEAFVPFDKANIIRPLKLFISVVPYGQGQGIVKLMEELGSTYSYIATGEGTGKNYLPGLLSANDVKKQIVFTFVRVDKSKEVCEVLENRFSAAKAANGIALSIKLTSVAGVSVYRFLSNIRKVQKVRNDDEF